MVKFDPSAAQKRLENFWALQAQFGMERSALHTYLEEIVSDRYALVNGMQLLRDELQFASRSGSDMSACGADLSVPSVCTTVAHTNCGDRIHQGEATTAYVELVARRFATMSEIGELKLEAFAPTGGGTDNGATLAHVTVAHQLDAGLRREIYSGHAQSFVLVGIDLKTHVGRLDEDGKTVFGKTKESPFREARGACGAIVGMLSSFNMKNGVHVRLRDDLGEENFAYLTTKKVLADDGTDITAVVAAAIVAVRGMQNVAQALATELDERGVGHVTATITVNRVSMRDPVIYLARATVFHGEIRTQGLGTTASRYTGKMIDHDGDRRLVLAYRGAETDAYPVDTLAYDVKYSNLHPAVDM